MNTKHLKTVSILLLGAIVTPIHGDVTLPPNDPRNAEAMAAGLAGDPYTAEELATPPAGEVQKKFLRSVSRYRGEIQLALTDLPGGPDGTSSPWYPKVVAVKNCLDTILSTRLQSDCFLLIPKIEDILGAGLVTAPDFAGTSARAAELVETTLVEAMTRHIGDQNGTVTTANIQTFIAFFSKPGFSAEGNWEGERSPINAPGIAILDPAFVVTHLKTRPWKEAAQFLGGRSVTTAFERYQANGDGLAILKTKYATTKTTVDAKWAELAAWVEEQSEGSE